MQIEIHQNFKKAYSKLSQKQKDKLKLIIEQFMNDPHHPSLKNHALHGEQRGRRAIAAGGDLRIIFIEEDNYHLVKFLAVGTHNQVY